MAARTDGLALAAFALLLGACSSPAPGTRAAPASTAQAQVADGVAPAHAPAAGPVDAGTLPDDVQAYILKQRMCRHLSQRAKTGEIQPGQASMICMAGGNAATWKSLIRKYAGNDTIGSVLVAEKPLDAEAR